MSILDKLSLGDILVIILYIILMIIISVRASKKIKNAHDYNHAGQNMSWIMIAGTCIATTMGANMVLGKYDLIVESGLSGIVSYLFWWVGWGFLLLLAKPLRESGAISIPQFIEKKYGSTARKIASYCVLLSMVSFCASSFLAIGNILEALGICNHEVGTWIGAIVVISFTIFSGLWGVVLTDTIQSVLLLIGFGILFPIIVIKTAGGWETIVAYNGPERMQIWGGIAPVTMLGWVVYNILSVGANATYAQRIFLAKSTRDAVRGHLVAWVFTLAVCGVFSALPGLASNMIFPEVKGSQFTPLFIVTYFPVIVRGLMLSILLALILTSGNSYLMLLSSTVVDDIIRPIKKDLSDKKVIFVTRTICVLSAGIICIMALYVDKLYQLTKTGGSAYGAGIFFPLVIGCFAKKVNARAVCASMVAGTLTSFCFDMFLKIPLGLDMDGGPIGAALCLIIILSGYLSKKEIRKSEE
ncbi:sodium:solute symporter family protein [Roseburia hominis]